MIEVFLDGAVGHVVGGGRGAEKQMITEALTLTIVLCREAGRGSVALPTNGTDSPSIAKRR
jgi:hypothetical protein